MKSLIRVLKKYLDLNRTKGLYFSILFFEKIFVMLFHFLFISYLERELYGLFNQINFYSNYIFGISLMGVMLPLTVSASDKNEKLFSTINNLTLFSIIISFIISSAIFFSNEYVSEFIFGSGNFKNFLVPLIIIVLSDVISEFHIVRLRINEEILKYSKFLLFRTFIRLSSIVIGYIIFSSYIIAILFSSIIYLLFSTSVYIRNIETINFFKFNFNECNKFLKQGLNFLVIYILSTASLALINLVITQKFELENLAVYNFNNTLSNIPITIVSYIVFYTIPNYSKNFIEIGLKESLKKLSKNILLAIFIIFSFLIISIILYDFIIIFLNIDNSYSDKYQYLLIFLLNTTIVINNFIQIPILNEKKFRFLMYLNSFIFLTNFLLVYFYPFKYEINTPIYTTFLTQIILTISLTIFLIKNFKLK